ncbi:SDR family NAD(P)-dependent oxidoreductase [Nocardia panacis]|uniref:SDR family NAD(P)-dependent oxidoreductase n=1 Tax=Nocardia panacis TaxID=2340916 RepID=A0A3A4JX43_9NOCA|nr:SDR family NAD(P)-dependent oxidoreductase [Nocardia panacis]RJO75159.1 SDR family NAD(P)-dependent oxidoreductase [Nocardia panacis]
MKLEAGQVAVVTGAAHGIGLAIASALHARGVRVVLADIEADALAQAAAQLGEETLAVPTDVADPDQVNALAAATLARFGRVDLVFNNAGTGTGGPMWDLDPEQWQRVWSINVGGVVNGIRAFVPHLISAGRGHIVNTASIAGVTTGPFNAPYTASKHAVVALSEALHGELSVMAPGIGVTVVCPGPVDTRMLRGITDISSDIVDDAALRKGQGWLGDMTDEQWGRFSPGLEVIVKMAAAMISPERAATIVLDAVENDRMFVTTHPEWAQAARQRMEDIAAELGKPNPQ